MISPKKLIYNNTNGDDINVFLNSFNVIFDVAFDSDQGETSSFLSRSAVASESYDGRYKHTHRYKYDELFSPRFTIVKDDFSDFTQEQVRKILKYLTQTDKPALLEVSYNDNTITTEESMDFCAIGGWTQIDLYKLANNRTVGIVATFEAITPYAMSTIYTVPINSTTEYKATISIDTDDNQPVYPRITIQQTGTNITIPSDVTYNDLFDMIDCVENTVYTNGSKFYWKSDEPSIVARDTEPDYGWTKIDRENAYTETDEIKEKTVYHYITDNKYRWIEPYSFKSSDVNPELDTTSVKITSRRYDITGQEVVETTTMIVKNNTVSEKIVVDGANRVISSDRTRRIFGDDFVDLQWLPLYDGTNELTIEGNCEVTIEYREVRKVGEY